MGAAVRAPAMQATSDQAGHFVMADGAILPYRAWMPPQPTTVLLALHGYNDSRNAWEIPGPVFMKADLGIIAPDQRGFGAAPGRGLWAGTDTLVADAATMAELVAARYPTARFAVMGESMGGAVAMVAAARGLLAPGTPLVLSAPAVWGRRQMNVVMRVGLWMMNHLLPWASASRPPVPIRASDNRSALEALFRDPLTLRSARFDTLAGLVNLMSAALNAASRLPPPTLFLYGAHDELVPKTAMLACWRAVAPGVARFCYFRDGWHLLLRDNDRALVIDDVVAWLKNPRARLVGEAAAAGLLAARYPALD
ncbi:MAG: alpha/beta fold hydrolase [Rhodospirillales bacterium]|jgi:alpha-beta hydrolase superfamily lysophospholipase|nr:alpha/beta fold hydrolase [Rhodospirillales bacterium]